MGEQLAEIFFPSFYNKYFIQQYLSLINENKSASLSEYELN